MSEIKIVLQEDHFKKLIEGKEVTIEMFQHTIKIVLTDIGYEQMNKMVVQSYYEDAKSHIKYHTKLKGGNK